MNTLMENHTTLSRIIQILPMFFIWQGLLKAGRGIEKICDSPESDGLPGSEYLVNPEDIMVKFTGS